MFLNLKVKNFKSFRDLNVDFQQKELEAKKNVFIYGENGSGKSNIVSAFLFLNFSTVSLFSVEAIKGMNLEESQNNYEEMMSNYFAYFDKEYRLIGSNDNMRLEYELKLKNKKATYVIETNSNGLQYESLRLPLDSNIVRVFEIGEEIYVNPKMFKNVKYRNMFSDLLQKYHKKYTFLAILLFELINNNDDYMKESIHESMFMFMDVITSLVVRFNMGKQMVSGAKPKHRNIDFKEGVIQKEKLELLEKNRVFLNDFFTALYSDVKSISYFKYDSPEGLRYSLVFDKMIGGQIVKVPYYEESTGTLNLLDLAPYLIKLYNGSIVIIDEIDTGIHDVLVRDLIMNILQEFDGQLIVTTHNTLLINELDADDIYVIDIDINGEKEILPISKSNVRVQNNHNKEKRYLSGMYSGVPSVGYLDIKGMVEDLCDGEDCEEELS